MSSRTTRLVIVVGVALVAGLVSFAVGRSFAEQKDATATQYETTVVKIRNRVDYSLEKMAGSKSVDELTTRLDEASDAVASAADDLDGTSVPEALQGPHDRLVSALEGLAGELSGTAATLRDPAFAQALPILSSLGFPQWDKANAALEAMRKHGIEVDALQRY